MVRVILNRGLDGKFQKLTEDLEQYGQIYGRMMAEDLVQFSPVDTGAYMDSFYAGSSYGGGGESSRGRPRQQPWAPYAEGAIQRMSSAVAALRGSTTIVFGNGAPHATDVEYKHGYAPFGNAASLHRQRMSAAWAEAKK
jgi:hypothetical protein